MQTFDIVVRSKISDSVRARQLESMFDVPQSTHSELTWHVQLPIDEFKWGVGMIVGPSGSGKSTIARKVFGANNVDRKLVWKGLSVVDDFPRAATMEEISRVCSMVGFNTIPAWLRPFRVLSTGEQFRATLARRFMEPGSLIVMDEFTSVVDRQVAKIGSHAVQKLIRQGCGKQFVAVTCHEDIIPWLRPDWTYHVASNQFERGRLRQSTKRQVKLKITIAPVPYKTWHAFSKFHYLTADLNTAARCFALFLDGTVASIAGMLYRPISRGAPKPVMGCSRLVTLPDFQGLGLAFVLIEKVAAWYRAVGRRTHTYPAHPALIHGFDRSDQWAIRKKPGVYAPASGYNSTLGQSPGQTCIVSRQGGRPCAVFSYEGEASAEREARRVLAYWPGHIAAKE